MRRYLTPGYLMLLALPVAAVAVRAGDLSVAIGNAGLVVAALVYLGGSFLWVYRAFRGKGSPWHDALLVWVPGAPVYVALAALLASPGGPDAAAMVVIPLLYVAMAFVAGSLIATFAVLLRRSQAAGG